MTKIYEAENHLFIHTGYTTPQKHCHKAAHIIVSLEEEMMIAAEDNKCKCRGILIPLEVSHQIDTNEKPVLVFLYDSTTNVAKNIRDVKYLSDTDCDEIVKAYLEFEKGDMTAERYETVETIVLEKTGVTDRKRIVMDERIGNALGYIRLRLAEGVTCKEVAEYVNLSQSRFSHLFKEQVGMTFASYLVYQRIMHVYAGIIKGKSITESSVEAGFYSASHFADVNRRVFGLAASDITKDMIFRKIK